MAAEPTSDLKFEIGHVLLIDIVGYSRLLINEQRERLETLNEIVRNTAQFRESEASGMLVRLPAGDGMALIFRDTLEAPVRCALEIGKALKNYSAITVRMGIHSGPVSEIRDVNERANIAGAGINTAQRVMDCGDAGHILLSKRVAEDLGQYRHWQPYLHELGECEVKHGVMLSVVNLYTDEVGNPQTPEKFKAKGQTGTGTTTMVASRPHSTKRIAIAARVVAVTVCAVGLFLFFHRSRPTESRAASNAPGLSANDKSIAVLPFENLSEDKANAYFADGIQDEILTRLAKIGTLKVISHTSTQRYNSAPANLSEIAKQLGVANLLEGSVQKADKQVRVNVQLIKADDGSHLWAETYDRNLNDIFSVESEVATAIADKLQAVLTGSEQRALASKPTTNLDAYDAYLRGLEFHRRTELRADQLQAEKYLKLAVSLDPTFALAWARLGRVAANFYYQDYDATPARREAARHAVEQATRLQPELGESWLAMGYYRFNCERNLELARAAFEKALQRLPNDSEVLMALSIVDLHSGRPEDSLALLAQALQLDPRNAILFSRRAECFLALRRFAEARAATDQALTISPQNAELVMFKAVTFQAEGDLERANQLLVGTAGSRIASLHPAQARGLFFERRYGDVISTLRSTMAERDASVIFTRDISYWLRGTAQKFSGDLNGSQSTFAQQRDALVSEIEKSGGPQGGIHSMLGLMYAGVGDKINALREAKRGLELEGSDTYLAPAAEEVLTLIEVETGDAASALARLPGLLNAHYFSWLSYAPLTPALLRLDPVWDPIRNDPRFQELISEKKP